MEQLGFVVVHLCDLTMGELTAQMAELEEAAAFDGCAEPSSANTARNQDSTTCLCMIEAVFLPKQTSAPVQI